MVLLTHTVQESFSKDYFKKAVDTVLKGSIFSKYKIYDKDKRFAIIHDLVVAPKIDYGSPSYNMERNLLNNEMKRVREFADLSQNSSDTVKELEDILTYYNLPTF